mmetsp:Transcript_18926/g.27330  ORF Transcript_18926/g.27330 Transcript_18926/m.27330 type:complete len:261 (-) Transcript_18926:178-960(-)
MGKLVFLFLVLLVFVTSSHCARHQGTSTAENILCTLQQNAKSKSIFCRLRVRGGIDSSLAATSGSSPVQFNPEKFNVGNAYTFQRNSSFLSVAAVCALNIIINMLRPDSTACLIGDKCIGARLQRLVWDVALAGISVLCSNKFSPPTPAALLLLQIMLIGTAIVDIFFYAPIYGFATEFETCKCVEQGFIWCKKEVCSDNFMFGLGRFSVVIQSLFTGLFFFAKAIEAGGAFRYYRDEARARKQAEAMASAINLARQVSS